MSKKRNSYKHQEDLNIMELQKCCVCKMSKEDVKLRVTDDLRCDLCIFKTTNQMNTGPNPTEEDSEVGATGHDDSRTICLLYENLLEKIVVKNRTQRGKIKTRIRWRGNLDSLKDFLTLVLRKNGTWIEHTKRTTSHTFKTGGLTLLGIGDCSHCWNSKSWKKKTREIIRFQEQLNTHVKFTPRDLPEDQDVVQLSPADPAEGSPNDWNVPKKTARHIFPPTWNPVPTFNKFDTLVDNSPPNDDQEASDEQSPPIKVQMENVKLQRHIQFLQKQISQSKPNLTCSTEEQMHTESTRTDTKTRTIENRNADNRKKNTSKRTKQSVTILGDSMINCQDEVRHSNENRIVRVRSFPGAATEDILDHCKPIARKKPDIIILHVGTNDLK